MLLRTLRHPIFLLVVLSQVCMSCMVAGMATFLPKFLERQFSITASYANMLIGGLTIPSAIVGIVVGGVLVKRLHLSPMRCGTLCLLGSLFCLLFNLPLFFIGCSTHQIAGIIHQPRWVCARVVRASTGRLGWGGQWTWTEARLVEHPLPYSHLPCSSISPPLPQNPLFQSLPWLRFKHRTFSLEGPREGSRHH